VAKFFAWDRGGDFSKLSNSEVNFALIKLRRVDRATSLVEERETIDEDADNASNPSLDSAPLNLFPVGPE